MDEKQFPEYFLGGTKEEANEVREKYMLYIKKMALTYHLNTGLDREDLESEGIFGLARALRDFDSNRSDNPMPLIHRYIKDSLNDFVRKNKNIIEIPEYIQQASNNISKLESILKRCGVDRDKIYKALLDGILKGVVISPEDEDRCLYIISKLQNNANRAGISFAELTRRVYETKSSFSNEEEVAETPEWLKDSDLILSLVNYMDDTDKSIVVCLLEGDSYTEIANKHGRTSRSWVTNRLRAIGDRVLEDKGNE